MLQDILDEMRKELTKLKEELIDGEYQLSLSLRANKYVILICFWFLFWALSIGKCKFICDVLSVVPVVVSCWRLVELHSTTLTPPSQRNRERKYDGRKKRLTVLKKTVYLKRGEKRQRLCRSEEYIGTKCCLLNMCCIWIICSYH